MAGFNPNKIVNEIYLNGELVGNEIVALSVALEVNRIPRARIELNYDGLEKNEGEQDDPILKKGTVLGEKTRKYRQDFLPGNEIKIILGKGDQKGEVFQGYITKQNLSIDSNGSMILTLDSKHKSNRMTLNKRTRFYHHDANNKGSQQDKIDVVNDFQVLEYLVRDLADYQFELEVDDRLENSGGHENMTQFNCTDWDFLVIRAEALGYVCLPEAETMKLIRPKVAETIVTTIQLGKDIFSYEAQLDETVSAERNVFVSWSQEKQGQNETNLKNSSVNSTSKILQTAKYQISHADRQDREMDEFLNSDIQRQKLGLVQGSAKLAGRVDLKVSDTVKLSGFKSIWDRDAFISGIRHELFAGKWFTHIQFGLSTISHAERYSISAENAEFIPKANGLVYGNVVRYKTSDSGQELIEVEITGYNEQNENGKGIKRTIYARLATFSAGANGGAVFRPYPNDEVVIGFVNNDPRFPVILGAVYNGKNLPPYAVEDHENQPEVGFSINGWNYQIHEKDEVLILSSPNGQQFILNDKEGSIAMVFDADNGIKISKEGVELSGKKILIKGQNGIELEAMKIEAKADTSLKLEGGTQLELEGKVTATLKGQITQIN